MSLTKAQIVEKIAAEIGFLKNKSTEIVETIVKLIKAPLASGDDVLITGFGKFCIQKRRRRGRNPSTGEDTMLEPR